MLIIRTVLFTPNTGARTAALADVESALKRVRGQTTLPVAVGFGLETPAQIRGIASLADAAVVGSVLVERVRKGLENGRSKDSIISDIHYLVSDLASATR